MRALLFVILSVALSATAAEPAWEKFEGCSLVEGYYRDGDSFTVRIKPRTFRVFRLYFVDAPEGTDDQRFPKRIAEQASYFGISSERALALGDDAAAFTEKALSRPFTVWTCGQIAPGSSALKRYYAMVAVDGRWLSSMLVEQGLARIYGKRISLPTGGSSRDYLAKLEALETQAKARRAGGWK